MELLAADVALVASGVSRDASGDQLKEFLVNKGINVVAVEKLTRDEVGARTNTFKVIVKLSDYEKAMKPDIWPYRVGVRHFKPPRRTGLNWQQQSSQSGGNLLNPPQSAIGRQTSQQQFHQNGGNVTQQSQSHHGSQQSLNVPGSGNRQGGVPGEHSPFTLNLQNRYSVLATADQNGDVFLMN